MLEMLCKYNLILFHFLKNLEILPVDLLDINKVFILLYIVFHNRCPEHMANLFKIKTETSDGIVTRQTNDYIIPHVKLKSKIDSPPIFILKTVGLLDIYRNPQTKYQKITIASYNKNFDL